jgi:hypothetical protein
VELIEDGLEPLHVEEGTDLDLLRELVEEIRSDVKSK